RTGRVLELRGDEALAVFGSPRQALRAAVELQGRFAAKSEEAHPLKVGIGLDAGEAVRVEGGYRWAALNLAARLCQLAGPGGLLAALPSGALVAREEELRHVRVATDAVVVGQGRTLLLAGEPGVGKTRLAQEVTLHVRNCGFLITAGSCFEARQSVPFYSFL